MSLADRNPWPSVPQRVTDSLHMTLYWLCPRGHSVSYSAGQYLCETCEAVYVPNAVARALEGTHER